MLRWSDTLCQPDIMKKLACLIWAIMGLIMSTAQAETMRTARFYSDARALSAVYSSFCQDADGFIWIGTDRGLLRFDGNSYDIYKHDALTEGSLSDSRILSLLCDRKGRVWVATASGLNLYDPTTDSFTIITLPDKNFYGYIIALTEQTDGTITFIVSGVGIYIVNDKGSKPSAVRYDCLDGERDFNSIVAGPAGRLYLGNNVGDVFCLSRNGQYKKFRVEENSFIKSLSLEKDGNLLIATNCHIYRLMAASGEINKLESSELGCISTISNADDKKTFIASDEGGLWEIAQSSSEIEKCNGIYSPFINLSTANIGALYAAPDGNLWIGCNYAGIVMLPALPIPFTYRKISDAFPDFRGGLEAIELWNSNILVGLDKGRLAMFSPEGRLLMKASVPGGGNISQIHVADNNTAFVSARYNGLWKLEIPSGKLTKLIDTGRHYTEVITAPGLPGELIVGIPDKGVMRYDIATGNSSWLPITRDGDQLSSSYVACLTRTPDDKVWIGLFGGIGCLDLKTGNLLHIDQQEFLKGVCFAIVPCLTDNSVWVGTSHGLVHLDPEKGVVQKFTKADGLSDNEIRSIARDYKGGKWVGTKSGISYVPAENNKIISFLGGHGLQEQAFNIVKSAHDGKTLYLGSDQGITSFHPDSIENLGFHNPVKLSGIYLNGRRLVAGSEIDGKTVIKGSTLTPEALYLPPHDNAISLRMSMMDFSDASNVSYLWRLSSGEEWIRSLPGENLIYLPHLDPGDYNLEICAEENHIMSAPLKIKVYIATPWYQSWWAKLLYAIIGIVFIVLAFIILKKKQEEEANEEKIRFFMDISHDIRSPMTLILNPLEALMQEPLDSGVKSRLSLMHRNAQRILGLVNQLLDIRKLEKGKMPLICRRTNINEFVDGLVELFRPQAAEKKQILSFSGSEALSGVWIDRGNVDKILVNILSNAIKYTPKGGNIDVSLEKTVDPNLGPSMKISVTDTGVGMDSETEAKIFDQFYRARKDQESTTFGVGIGLDLSRRLAELHHGTITGSNRSDGVKGSVFTLTIPLDEAAYDAGELIDGQPDPASEVFSGRSNTPLPPPLSPQETLKQKPNSAGKKVLVVDDDEEIRKFLRDELSRYYQVNEAPDGIEGLRIIGEWNPDIIVSDVVMSGMDGLTLLRRLKSGADTNHIPVVLLSSKSELSDRMAGWEKGADGYLGKPFSLLELLTLIDTLIENRQRMRGKFSGKQATEGIIEGPQMKGNDEILLERLQKAINKHIDDSQFNVERLAEEVGVSRAQLHRKMKDILGLTPSDYIRNVRLKRACELLMRPDIEVTQVAYQIGFASQPHFSSHFKKYTGFTPSEYRARNLKS